VESAENARKDNVGQVTDEQNFAGSQDIAGQDCVTNSNWKMTERK